jgi:hypothetical protein
VKEELTAFEGLTLDCIDRLEAEVFYTSLHSCPRALVDQPTTYTHPTKQEEGKKRRAAAKRKKKRLVTGGGGGSSGGTGAMDEDGPSLNPRQRELCRRCMNHFGLLCLASPSTLTDTPITPTHTFPLSIP